MSDEEVRRYCHRERREFPESEFKFVPEWGWIHTSNPEHTDLGTPIKQPMVFEELGGM